MTLDKRKEARAVVIHPFTVSIRDKSGKPIDLKKVVNVSSAGLSVIVANSLVEGELIRVKIIFNDGSNEFLEGEGAVLRTIPVLESRSGKDSVCAISLELTDEQREKLATFIASSLSNGLTVIDRRAGTRNRNGLEIANPVQFDTTFRLSHEHLEVQIRELNAKDLNDLVNVEIKAWGEEMCATRAMLKSRLETYPEGMIGAFQNNALVGYVGLMKINSATCDKDFTWMGITDGGLIRATHNPNGDCLYGVSLSVIPSATKDVAVHLLKAAGKLSVRKSLKGILFGCRIPNFHKHHKSMTVEQYINATSKKGRILDPELSLYRQVNCVPVRPIPEYFEDPYSLNYGVLVFFENPFYGLQKKEFPFFFKRISVDFT